MEYVICVNRTDGDLEACWGGRRYPLKPGDNPLPLRVAEAAKRQNPIMGSGTNMWDMEFLVGIRELGDPIDPVKQSDSLELMDPVQLHGAKPHAVIAGKAQAFKNVNVLKNDDGQLDNAVKTGFAYNEDSPRGVNLP